MSRQSTRVRTRATSRAGVAALLAVVFALLYLTASGCGAGDGCGPQGRAGVVETTAGLVSGREAQGLWVYRGVPYAAPPVGDLRWRPPQAPEAWDGVRSCDDDGPSCPQPGAMNLIAAFDVGETSEDCLYLNVWTPALRGGAGTALPVMVFIHGGSFASGSGSLELYDGSNLARLGAVIVTVNYRLGPLGFFAHPELSDEDERGTSGNYGLLDQVAALEWVRHNIAGFGGDPGNVTVFGESAGGMSICDLMVSPRAEGLFARAIVQSGPFDSRGAGMDAVRSLAEAEKTGEEVSRRLGCEAAPDEVAALRAVPVERLLAAGAQAVETGPGGIGFGPVVDGVVLPGDPAALFAAGEIHDVDLLVGANADEANLFLLGMRGQTPAQLVRYVRRLYEPYGDEVLALFPAAPDGPKTAALSKAVTVMGFVAPARFAAASVARAGGATYLYHFARRPPVAGDLGAFHGLELPYVFGNSALTLDVHAGVEGELSAAMMRYWVSFARDGDPNGKGGAGDAASAGAGEPLAAGGDPAAGLPHWPRYDSASGRCLILDAAIRAASAPYRRACDLADRLRAARLAGGG